MDKSLRLISKELRVIIITLLVDHFASNFQAATFAWANFKQIFGYLTFTTRIILIHNLPRRIDLLDHYFGEVQNQFIFIFKRNLIWIKFSILNYWILLNYWMVSLKGGLLTHVWFISSTELAFRCIWCFQLKIDRFQQTCKFLLDLFKYLFLREFRCLFWIEALEKVNYLKCIRNRWLPSIWALKRIRPWIHTLFLQRFELRIDLFDGSLWIKIVRPPHDLIARGIFVDARKLILNLLILLRFLQLKTCM